MMSSNFPGIFCHPYILFSEVISYSFLNVYLFWERGRELVCIWKSASGGGEQRKGERENPKGALHWQWRAPLRARSHKPVRSWPEPKSRVRCLTDWAAQAPLLQFVFLLFFSWVVWVHIIEFWEFIMYSAYNIFIRYVFCKDFSQAVIWLLPFLIFSFPFLNNCFCKSKILMKPYLSVFHGLSL